MRKYFFLGFGSCLLLLSVILFIYATGTDRQVRKGEFNSMYGIFALDLPENPSFAGEAVPMHISDVRERFDRELLVNTYWQSQTLLLLKRKERWFGIIEPILKQNQIPDDFKYLALAESGLTNVVSPSGASGFWQFLEGTGKNFGLKINSEVDERYHLEKATVAACSYLKSAYQRFNSWSLVAASYNMGIEGVSRQLEKQQVKSYYDLLLVEETSRYVFRILALKEICENPLDYGFHFRKRDFYKPYHFVITEVDTTIPDLAKFAQIHAINYKELKLLNPWLRSNSLTVKPGEKYEVKIRKNNPGESVADESDTLWMKTLPEKEFHRE
jgi:membrane-bound lytic murein transglycosylase D